jgi:hypothetical protein
MPGMSIRSRRVAPGIGGFGEVRIGGIESAASWWIRSCERSGGRDDFHAGVHRRGAQIQSGERRWEGVEFEAGAKALKEEAR